MKLTVLVDNFTYIDQYYHGEPAAAYYLELEDKRILFDTGYSEIVLSNAEKMGIDLSKLTHIVFSHGHDDHTRGFKFLADKIDLANVEVIAHPACFLPKYSGDLYIGASYSLQEMQAKTNFKPLAESYALTDKLIYLGQIPRTNDYENKEPIGSYEQDGKREADYLLDDTALAYRTNEGLFIITGCSHSGICNIIEYAKKVCGEERICGVLGGFHIFEDDMRLAKTVEYLEKCNLQKLYPAHCVSLIAKAKMMAKLPVVEVGVGMQLDI